MSSDMDGIPTAVAGLGVVSSNWIGAFVLLGLIVSGAWILIRRQPRYSPDNPIPYAYGIIWLVLILQNIIAQAITGPVTKWAWREQIFSVYYLVLFVITAFIVQHYHSMRMRSSLVQAGSGE